MTDEPDDLDIDYQGEDTEPTDPPGVLEEAPDPDEDEDDD